MDGGKNVSSRPRLGTPARFRWAWTLGPEWPGSGNGTLVVDGNAASIDFRSALWSLRLLPLVAPVVRCNALPYSFSRSSFGGSELGQTAAAGIRAQATLSKRVRFQILI